MKKETEQEYLLQAIDALEKEVAIISPELKIMAANRFSIEKRGRDILGGSCYRVFYNYSDKCDNCPHNQVVLPGKTEDLKSQSYISLLKNSFSCRPIYSDKKNGLRNVNFGSIEVKTNINGFICFDFLISFNNSVNKNNVLIG